MKKDIINFVERNSRLSTDQGDELSLIFSTRENGDTGNEEYSEIDYRECVRVKYELKKEFGDKIEVDVDTFDEWVMVEVIIKI